MGQPVLGWARAEALGGGKQEKKSEFHVFLAQLVGLAGAGQDECAEF